MLRLAQLADAQRIAEIHVQSWRETYKGIMPNDLLAEQSVESRAQMWTYILQKQAKSARVIVVEQTDGAIVGFAACGEQRSQSLPYPGEFYAVYVLKAAQRQGYGRDLMIDMSEHLVKKKLDSAALWVVRENLPARKFYESIGGDVVAEREDKRPSVTLVEVAYAWDNLPIHRS